MDRPPRRIGLVGCVKAKATRARPARDLYTSTLFLGRRAYVEATCDDWWILSALHGLLGRDEVVEPYDLALKDLSRAERAAWSREVLEAIDDQLELEPGDAVELHAGAEYREFGLVDGLLTRGCVVENPTAGMRIGQQLSFYQGGPRP